VSNKLIVIEGLDGSGKSTLSNSLFKRIPTTFQYREPFDEDGFIANYLDSKFRFYPLDPLFLTFLYIRDRAENKYHVENQLRYWDVLCDRSRYSTYAYQNAMGVDMGKIREIEESFASPSIPDLVIFLDMPTRLAMERIGNRGSRSYYEKADFLAKVRRNYRDIFVHKKYDWLNCNSVVIDATLSEQEVLEGAIYSIGWLELNIAS